MKKVLRFCVSFGLIVLMVVTSTLTASAATKNANYDSLASYINKYGFLNSDGERVIKYTEYGDTYDHTYAFVDQGDSIACCMMSDSSESTRIDEMIEVTISKYSSTFDLEFFAVFYSDGIERDDAWVCGTSTVSDYTEDDTFSFDTCGDNGIISYESVDDLGNSALDLLFISLDIYLYDYLGFGFKGLGFVSYEGLGLLPTDLCTHAYNSTVTKATQTANGEIVKTCAECGKTTSTVIYKASTVKLAKTKYVYSGKAVTPAVVVKNSAGKALVKGTDYTVTYATGRKAVGKYAVKITFKGKYKGSKTLYFTIVPKSTTIRRLTPGSKKITVAITKRAIQTTGYQIQYSTSAKFARAKTVTILKNTTLSKTIGKLYGGKKYYVRVRTYKTVNGVKYYSAWSLAKATTTKR